MPYNTRRKSLSLSELGIAIPKRARNISHLPTPESSTDADAPAAKKSKLSHDGSASPVSVMSPPRTTSARVKEEKRPVTSELSPPPSPKASGYNKVDLEGVHDDIVIATIRQLEDTGNRPLFVRELGAILAQSLACVEKSANPTALISSRLTQYLGRPWPTISPCPLAKDLSTSHPRRLYFYLTTLPRQPVPDVIELAPKVKRIISPSLSSASAVDEEEVYNRQRTALSPSPEVDLSSPELEDDATESASLDQPFSGRSSLTRGSSASSHIITGRRAASPQLEMEERDFKQTANALYEQAQQRRKSSQGQDVSMAEADADSEIGPQNVNLSIEGDYGVNDATTLFGHLKSPSHPRLEFSSPVIRPRSAGIDAMVVSPNTNDVYEHTESTTADDLDVVSDEAVRDSVTTGKDMHAEDNTFSWDALDIPESIELDELDDMFDAYC